MIFHHKGIFFLVGFLLLNAFGFKSAFALETRTVNGTYGPINQYTYYLNAAGEEVKHGVETRWYADQYRLMSQRVHYSHGKKHGLDEAWYNGSYSTNWGLHWSRMYQNGLLHGVSQERYSNGLPQSYAVYKYGKRHGSYTEYFYDYQHEKITANYHDGLLHGDYKEWVIKTEYYNGYSYKYPLLAEEGAYEYGKKNGHWKRWYYDTTYYMLKEQGDYGNDQKCGTWQYYWSTTGNLKNTDFLGACHYSPPPGGTPPPPPGTTYSISGHVFDKATKSPVAGALVQAGSAEASTDAQGTFSLSLESGGAVILNCVASGYYDFTKTVNLDDAQIVTTDIDMKAKAPGAKPAVTNVDATGGIFFIAGLSANNAYRVSVDWQDDAPGTVVFEVNGTAHEVTADASGASRTFDMGTVFTPSLSPTGNTLKITAVNYSGVSSDPEVINPIVIPLPGWSVSFPEGFEIKTDGSHLVYKLSANWPEEPIEVLISEGYLGSTVWQLWGLVPYIGGREFGIPNTQSFFEIEAKTDGTGSIAAGGTSGFKAAGGEITIKLGGKGNLKYEPNTGLEWKETSLILGLSGEIEKEVGPVTLIPALEGAVNLPLIGGAIGWFNDRAKIKGTLSSGSEMALEIMSATGEIGFNKADVETSLGMTLGMGIEIIDDVEADVTGGGTGKVFWQVPANPDYFKKLETELSGTVTFTLWDYAWSTGYTHPYTYPETTGQAIRLPMATPELRPVSRDFASRAPYNRLVSQTPRTPMSDGGAGVGEDTKVIENVYPHSQPVVAEHDGDAAIAYVHLDAEKPDHQATEIMVTFYDGASQTFSTPLSIEDDTRAEFAPTIAYDTAGKVVCVWQRVKDAQFISDQITDLAAKLEIVYAVYDPSAQAPAWTEPVALTDNDFLDNRPVLKRGDDGSLLLVWFSNAGNQLIGSAEHPTQMHYAFWNEADFDTATAVPFTFEHCFNFSLAYNGTEATLAFTKDMDGVLFPPEGSTAATTDDEEVFTTTYNGASWESPTRVTEDAVPDTGPQVVYAGGAAELIWLRGNALVRRQAAAPLAVETIRDEVISGNFLDFRLYADPADHLVLLWQEVDDTGVDIFYAVYDTDNAVWSENLRLTDDPQMERDFRGVFDDSGMLHLVFNKKDDAADPAVTDLHHLTYRLAMDLSVVAGSLAVDPSAPAPGDPVTLSVQVANTGDLAAIDAQAAFYIGNPDSGGTLIDIVPVAPSTLRAGDTGQAELAWTVPAGIEPHTVYAVVDPNGTVIEINEGNNTAHLDIIRPDLSIIQCRLEPGIGGAVNIRAAVRNEGIIAAENITVLFKAEESIIDTLAIPVLLPGKTAELVLPASLDFYTYTRWNPTISAVADPEDTISEFDETNNAAGDVYTLDVISPTATDFGKAYYETNLDLTHFTSAVQTITIANRTATAMPIGAVTIVGADAGEFSLPDNTCSNGSIAAYQSCLMGVAFTPTAPPSYGNKFAEIVIYDDQGSEMRRVPLSGSLGELLRGDLSDNGAVDIADAVIALRIAAGYDAPDTVNTILDVNTDNRIGLEEAFFALQKAAGIER